MSKHKKNNKKEQPASVSTWSKSKKKRMRAKKVKESCSSASGSKTETKRPAKPQSTQLDFDKKVRNKSSLMKKFKARLWGSRFRLLNEELYTTSSTEAFEKFSKQPKLFEEYHQGFRHQVKQWPVNPVHLVVNSVKKMANAGKKPLVVADFGCGDAELAKTLHQVKQNRKCPFKVHSFDLVAACDLVTACDMSKVPLQPGSVHVAVFCLSLMGTNMADFVCEAHRVLQIGGCLKIVEVKSRFDSDLDDFLKTLSQLGFDLLHKDEKNKMFLQLELRKTSRKPQKDVSFTAKPCIYKRR